MLLSAVKPCCSTECRVLLWIGISLFRRLINDCLADELDMDLEQLDIQTGDGSVQTFQTSAGIIQFHLSPPGLPEFAIVEERAITCLYNGIPVKYLNLDDLLSSKKAVARAKDSDDILFLTIKKQNQ